MDGALRRRKCLVPCGFLGQPGSFVRCRVLLLGRYHLCNLLRVYVMFWEEPGFARAWRLQLFCIAASLWACLCVCVRARVCIGRGHHHRWRIIVWLVSSWLMSQSLGRLRFAGLFIYRPDSLPFSYVGIYPGRGLPEKKVLVFLGSPVCLVFVLSGILSLLPLLYFLDFLYRGTTPGFYSFVLYIFF